MKRLGIMHDFTAITETPGSALNAEQLARILHRYQFATTLACDKDVLEVACGAGSGLGMLQRQARSLIGCDYTTPVLRMAQAHYTKRVPLVGADAQRLPFAPATFDLLLSFEAIYYLPKIELFLAEAQRVLRDDGLLLLCTSNPDWPPFVPGQMSVAYPNLPTLATLLADAGFQQAEFYGALPLQNATSRQSLHAVLRKYLLQFKFFTTDSPWTRRLKQVAYGRLTPLPAELTAPIANGGAAMNGVTPLLPTAPDRIHRVLFAIAQKVSAICKQTTSFPKTILYYLIFDNCFLVSSIICS